MNLAELLTPKKIFLDAMIEKLQPYNISKLVLYFFIETEKYNLFVSQSDGKSMKIEITSDEIGMIKKIFINRIITKWNEKYNIEVKAIILSLQVDKKLVEVHIETVKNNIHKFDF